MNKHKVAFIGAGKRARHYGNAYVGTDDIEIVALADPSAEHRRDLARLCKIPGGFGEYDNWRELLKAHKDLDGVVISSPNYAHADPAVACLERGIPLALEKPLASTKKDCERIIDAERANNGRTLIGFVLRSTPFYGAIQRLVREGAVGAIVSIQADELPGWGISSNMFRQPWRRHQATSGGSLLEKCCHDLDMLNWLMDSRPQAIASFGGRRIFVPNPALPERCDDCGVAKQCKYYKRVGLVAKGAEQAGGAANTLLQLSDGDRCIYNLEKDTADAQSVAIEYESGAVANFLMNFNTGGKRAGRNIHIVGHKGRIWGALDEMKVYRFDNATNKLGELALETDGSSHAGGDRRHALELRRMMADAEYRPEQDATAGYLSAVMCFAADASRVERRRVELVYAESGHIEIR